MNGDPGLGVRQTIGGGRARDEQGGALAGHDEAEDGADRVLLVDCGAHFVDERVCVID